jgi:hypothetical protein
MVRNRTRHRPPKQDQLVVDRTRRGEKQLVGIRPGRDLTTLDSPAYDDRRTLVSIDPELGECLGGFRRTKGGCDHGLGDGGAGGERRMYFAVDGDQVAHQGLTQHSSH